MDTFIETKINSWQQILNLKRRFLHPFVFRGQNDSKWDLETSLEREVRKYSLLSDPMYATGEKWMLHEFTRKLHLYSDIKIPIDDKSEWLALMQHHGAPTRLLDFTESIYIAAFFAVIDTISDSAVWGINTFNIRDNLLLDYNLPYNKGEALKDEVDRCHIDFANQFIAINYKGDSELAPKTLVPIEPKRCSERLARQQGLFLMPTNCETAFMDNLCVTFKKETPDLKQYDFDDFLKITEHRINWTKIDVFKIVIPEELRFEIYNSLQEMNITAEVLFPGLDGLAKSLKHTQIFN